MSGDLPDHYVLDDMSVEVVGDDFTSQSDTTRILSEDVDDSADSSKENRRDLSHDSVQEDGHTEAQNKQDSGRTSYSMFLMFFGIRRGPSQPIPVLDPAEAEMNRKKKLKRAYVSVFIMFLVNLLNYMDRFTVAGRLD